MLAFLWGSLFAGAGMLIALMLLLLRPFFLAPKNIPTLIFFGGLSLETIGIVGNTIVFAHLPVTFELSKDVPNLLIFVPAVFPLSFFFGFLINSFYLITIRKKPSKLDLCFGFFPVPAGIVLLSIFKMSSHSFLGLEGQDQQTVVDLIASTFSLYACIWLQFQLNLNLNTAEYLGRVLKLVSNVNIFFIAFVIADIIFLMINFYADYLWINQIGSLPFYELFVKPIKLTFMILIELILGLHWLQVFSITAIQEREGRQRVQELLVEKDALIQSLINKQALAETGALAAGLTHELNQYLARIQLNNEELLIKSNQHSAQELLDPSLNRISQSTHSASKLILSIKKLFKKEKEELKYVQPDRLIEDVLVVFKPRLDQSEIQVVYFLNCKEKVELWDTLFRQVISNLFLNAIEALETRQQSIKRITVSTEVVDSNFICCISDNGPGVPKSITDEVFPLFKTTKSSGTGVGLWLSKYIVERHKGTLQILQSAEGGALLRVAIPLRHPTFEGL